MRPVAALLATAMLSATALPAQTEPPSPPPASSGTSTQPDQKGQKANPCKADAALAAGWLDRLQLAMSTTVCGSAVWFDSFFGDTREVGPGDYYGHFGAGFLYKTNVGWESNSRFDARIPLPNLQRKTNLFLGRADEDSYISDQQYGPGDEIGSIATQTGQDWLAGLGYTPISSVNSQLEYKLGLRVSSDPYVFGQARYRYFREVSTTQKWRIQETVFYRTDADGFGTTTSFTYDWRLKPTFLGRSSASATLSQDTDGVKWKYQAILYENLGGWRGHERAMAYKALIQGETSEIDPVSEYGLLVTYRQQFLRPWLFAEPTLGYTWVDSEDTDWERTGAVNIGLLFDVRFGRTP